MPVFDPGGAFGDNPLGLPSVPGAASGLPDLSQPRLDAVLAVLASRTQRAPADVDPAVFASELLFLRATVAARYPCAGGGSALAFPDSVFYDTALGLMMAARLYGPLMSAQAGGIITGQSTADGTKESYLAPDPEAPQKLAQEGVQSLLLVSCIQAGQQAQAASVHLMGVAGRRRTIRAQWPYTLGGCGGSAYGWGLGLLDLGLFPLGGLWPIGDGYVL